jgi:hypothetical protein
MMPKKMCALAHSQGQEQICASLKYIEASMTIVVGGMDVDIVLFVELKRFIKE